MQIRNHFRGALALLALGSVAAVVSATYLATVSICPGLTATACQVTASGGMPLENWLSRYQGFVAAMILCIAAVAASAATAATLYHHAALRQDVIGVIGGPQPDVFVLEASNSRKDTPPGELPDLDVIVANWNPHHAHLMKIEIVEPRVPFSIQSTGQSDRPACISSLSYCETSPADSIVNIPSRMAIGRQPGLAMLRLVTHDKGSDEQAGQSVPLRIIVHCRAADAIERITKIELNVRRGSHEEYEF